MFRLELYDKLTYFYYKVKLYIFKLLNKTFQIKLNFIDWDLQRERAWVSSV